LPVRCRISIPSISAIRPVERQVLRVVGVADFLSFKTASAAPTTG